MVNGPGKMGFSGKCEQEKWVESNRNGDATQVVRVKLGIDGMANSGGENPSGTTCRRQS